MTENALKDIPEHLLMPIVHFVTGFHNLSDREVNSAFLKPALSNIYVLFIIQYGVLALIGVLANAYIIYYILHHKLYHDGTHAFMVNLCMCHLVQCAFVLPVTLMVILIQNWIFGQFMCYFVPLLQDIPLHAALLTHMLIAWDRMRWLGDPMSSRLPAFVCSCATWLTGMVIALPYPIYTTYLDLGLYLPHFRGVGICIVNLVDDMLEYTRGLFFLMYCAPTTILGYLYIHTAREMRPPEGPLSVMMYEQRAEMRNSRKRSTASSTHSGGGNRANFTRSYDLYDAELDAIKEKRSQCHLGGMAATQVICICPLMILRIARMVLVETYENTAHFDVTYLMFVWMAFLPTVINPFVYASWILSRPAKDRLRRYFRLSSRGQSESDNKLTPQQPSQDDSATHGNTTTETIDESLKVFDTQQKAHTSRSASGASVTGALLEKPRLSKSSASSISCSRNRSRKRSSIEELHARAKKNSIDDIDNSCSNITASTYCNENGVSISSGIGIDFDSGGGVGGGGIGGSAYNERKPLCSRDSVFSSYSDRNLNRSRDRLSDAGESLSARRESSSTYERDMDIIDSLERERSMDTISTQVRAEPDSRAEKMRPRQPIARKNSSFERHRKLPDITKIAAPNSPKRMVLSTAEHSPNFPNFVFTHQQHLPNECTSSSERTSSRNRTHSTAPLPRNAFDADDPSGFDAFAQSFNSRAPQSRKSSTKSIRDTRVHSGKYGDSIYTDNL